MDNDAIKNRLYALKDEQYLQFKQKIILNAENIIGVRVGELRKIAKQIMHQDYLAYLQNARDDSYEEILLQGMVIGYSKLSFVEMEPYIKKYVAKITNWALCDLFVSGLKLTKNDKQEMFAMIKSYLQSESTYDIRFSVVMLLTYYLNIEYCTQAFHFFDQIQNDDYYVQMAIAWAISMYYIVCKEQTLQYLEHHHLNPFTYQKALQKIIESKQTSKEEKEEMRKLKKIMIHD